jgi:molybdopterin synthase catalytic subunit
LPHFIFVSMQRLTKKPLDPAALLASVQSPAAGAVLLFVGTTREQTGGRATASLTYEAYADMALAKLAELEATARARWPLIEVAIEHRLGPVAIGEASVAIAVSSAHRAAAFAAGQWLIDTLKEVVPIWKCEHWADGAEDWVHPGA